MKYIFLLPLLLFSMPPVMAQPAAALPLEDTLVSIEPSAARIKELYVLPLASYSPETSLRVGGVAAFLFPPTGCTQATQLSSVRIPITYTFNRQQKARFSYEIFLNDNQHILSGYIQWQKFPFFFYGIGAGATEKNEETYTSRTAAAQASYLNNLAKNFFLGPRFVWVNNKVLEQEPGGLLSREGLIPGSDGSLSIGMGIIGRYDSRDNNLNTGRGLYLQSSLSTFPERLGSDFPFTKLELDVRKFFRPFRKHVLAVQLFGEYNWGQPPFEMLAFLGGDELMRGHYEGRFRDKTFWAAQLEYRLPINRSDWFGTGEKLGFWKRWGMVGFAGFGTVGPDLQSLGDSELRYSTGVGIRYLILPKERVNIRLDFGFGTQRPGFYFNVREAF